MTTVLETYPVLDDTGVDNQDGFSHYARKTEILDAAINGGRIKAICGYEFAPLRDPNKFPVCPRCKSLVGFAEQMG